MMHAMTHSRQDHGIFRYQGMKKVGSNEKFFEIVCALQLVLIYHLATRIPDRENYRNNPHLFVGISS